MSDSFFSGSGNDKAASLHIFSFSRPWVKSIFLTGLVIIFSKVLNHFLLFSELDVMHADVNHFLFDTGDHYANPYWDSRQKGIAYRERKVKLKGSNSDSNDEKSIEFQLPPSFTRVPFTQRDRLTAIESLMTSVSFVFNDLLKTKTFMESANLIGHVRHGKRLVPWDTDADFGFLLE